MYDTVTMQRLRYPVCMRLGRILLTTLVFTSLASADWPQWRGPEANGHSDETGLPVEWGPEKNILWRASLPGVGASTPIVWGDQIFITMQLGRNPIVSPTSEGPLARTPQDETEGVQFLVRSYQLSDGKLGWEHRFAAQGDLQPTHGKHNLASPSCTTDGKLVYAWMGTGQIVALDLDGKPVWQRHIGDEYAPFHVRWGHGSSPAIYKNSLFLLCDHQAKAYLLALDKSTGEEIWKVDRGEGRSYTTPFIVAGDDADQLVINSSARIDVYDPATGKLLWHVGEPNRVPISTPVFHDGVLYTSRGYRSGPYLAVKPGGSGDVTSSHINWRVRTGAPYISSLLYHDGLVYLSAETGVASCVDATNGELLWKQRLGGYFSASPVYADGKIYMVNEEGETFVIEAGRGYKLLAKNILNERTLASPAIAKGRIILRTDEHLVAIGK